MVHSYILLSPPEQASWCLLNRVQGDDNPPVTRRQDLCQYHVLSVQGGRREASSALSVHGSRVTAVPMRTRCSTMEPDLAPIGPEATAEGGVSNRSAQHPARQPSTGHAHLLVQQGSRY